MLKKGFLMKMKLGGWAISLLLVLSCDNLWYPLTIDQGVSAQGRLERSKGFMREDNFDRAAEDVAGAISLNDTLSEAYYLGALIELWRYGMDVDNIKKAVTAVGDTGLTRTSPLPFSDFTTGKRDSLQKGNYGALRNLEILRSGKSPATGNTLDSVYVFKDRWLDYAVAGVVLGIVSLYDVDTTGGDSLEETGVDALDSLSRMSIAAIDSLDSLATLDVAFIMGDTGFGVMDTSDVGVSIRFAAAKSLYYFDRVAPFVDSLADEPLERDSDAYTFRRKMKTAIQRFRDDLPFHAGAKGTPKGGAR